MDYRSIVYKLPLIKQQRLPRHHPTSNLNKIENTGDYSLEINESGDLDGLIDDEDAAITNGGASSSIFKKGISGSGSNTNPTMIQRKRISKSSNENNQPQKAVGAINKSSQQNGIANRTNSSKQPSKLSERHSVSN
jgi:hypothetical protein